MLENGVPEAGDGHLLISPGVVAVGVEVSADEGLRVSGAGVLDGGDRCSAVARG